nr:MAG TPA: hypothetical protein [Caudoviricetes sp.]
MFSNYSKNKSLIFFSIILLTLYFILAFFTASSPSLNLSIFSNN